MTSKKEQGAGRVLSIKQMQWLIWLAAFVISFLSLILQDSFGQALILSALSAIFYAFIVYGNILLLFPALYQKGRKISYALASFFFVVLVSLVRAYLTLSIYNTCFAKEPEPLNFPRISYYLAGGFLIYLLSFVFRIAIAYFRLRQQNDQILAQKSLAELNLLKSQVQPHFLFNTLNNIYYEAYREAPQTALLIEKLAEMMRYFVDESPKETLSLNVEVTFLENYIALEQIRMRHNIEITFDKTYQAELQVPPMLLMTFVENLFKHGIDKSKENNRISIALKQSPGYLEFETRNDQTVEKEQAHAGGFGIENLRKRLEMLYGNDFILQTGFQDQTYLSLLKIPIR